MPSVDTQQGLQAINDVRRLIDTWPALQARLGGSGGSGGLDIRVHTSDPAPLPINLAVSDLISNLDWNVARHYARVLQDEYGHTPPAWTTRALLVHIVEHGGDLITDARHSARFVTDADTYRRKVDAIVETRAPLRYWGECPTEECGGELHMRDDEAWVRCENCTRTYTIQQLRQHIEGAYDDALLNYDQIGPALKILDLAVTPRTVRRWVAGGRLTPESDATPARYSLAKAAALARSGRKHAP